MQPFPPRARQIGMKLNHRGLLVTLAAAAAAGPLLVACATSAGSGKVANGAAAPAGRAFGAPGAAPAHEAAPAPAPTAAQYGLNLHADSRALLTSLGKPVPLAASQSIIYTANLVLRVKDVTTASNLATGIVIGAGGYVAGEQENLQPNGGTPQVSLTLKIPVAVFQQTLAKLAALGHQLAFSRNAVDVTQQVADVNSRVASAQAAIRQLRALLSRAGSVGELLNVQDQINTQETNLEALLAQQQALAHETSYATVSVLVLGHHAPFVHHHKKTKSHNFVTGLGAGWHAFGTAVSWVLTGLGAVLPFAVLLALAAGLAWTGRRRLVRRRRPPTATPPAEAA
jgi:hypothetical protein